MTSMMATRNQPAANEIGAHLFLAPLGYFSLCPQNRFPLILSRPSQAFLVPPFNILYFVPAVDYKILLIHSFV
jgi:hypothetical protein